MLSKTVLLFLLLTVLTVEAKIRFSHDVLNKKLISEFTQASKNTMHSLVRGKRSAEESDEEVVLDVTDENFMDMLKWFTYVAWEADKGNVLGTFIEEQMDSDSNITVIGWQRVLGDDGKVVQINTVQMVVPPKPNDGATIVASDDDDEEEYNYGDRFLPHDDINELREILEPWTLIGTPASMTLEEFDSNGKCTTQMYMDCDEMMLKAEGFGVYNKTVKDASEKDVEEFISQLKPNDFVPPAILKRDVDNHLIADKSKINAQFLGNVLDADVDVPEAILLEAPQVIADISQKNCESDIPKKLGEHYNTKHPEYKWSVLEDPSDVYINRDIYLVLSYDNFDLFEHTTKGYVVNGKKVAA